MPEVYSLCSFLSKVRTCIRKAQNFESVHHNTAVNICRYLPYVQCASSVCAMRILLLEPYRHLYFWRNFLPINQFTTIRTSHSQPCSTEAYASLPLPPLPHTHTLLGHGADPLRPPTPIPSPLFTWLVCSTKKVPIEGEVCKAGFMGLLYKWKKIFMLTKLILNCKYQITILYSG